MTAAAPGRQRPLRVFVIAGEESGDRLGGALMAALTARAGRPVSFRGVGGRAMTAQALHSLFPLADLAINGFSAVVVRLPQIIARIREAADAVVADDPDVLVIIDSAAFTHRVARRVRAQAPQIPIVDYVSPQVWASRPGRAAAMRAYVDHVLALYPFEPDAHRRLGGPPCTYVGHPLAEEVAALRPGPAEVARRNASPPLLVVLPGSRGTEIARHLGVFGDAVGRVRDRVGALEVVVPTVPHLAQRVRQGTAAWPVTPRIVVDAAERHAAFRQARAALAKSGTVTLELALAKVPTVLAYKVTLIDEMIVRTMIQVKMVGLANIILDDLAMPEFLQRDATPGKLADALVAVMADQPARQRQLAAFDRLDALMEIGAAVPSERAADVVLRIAEQGRPVRVQV